LTCAGAAEYKLFMSESTSMARPGFDGFHLHETLMRGIRAARFDRPRPMLVLDEADHRFDMAFLRDIRQILAALPEAASEPALLGHGAAGDSPAGR
jgi:superfamily II DNA/RNA helicase